MKTVTLRLVLDADDGAPTEQRAAEAIRTSVDQIQDWLEEWVRNSADVDCGVELFVLDDAAT